MKILNRQYLIYTVILFMLASSLTGWELHTLIAHPVFSSMSEVSDADSVKVTSLQRFLSSVEAQLEITLAAEEAWAQNNLNYYMPLPKELSFKATGNPDDLISRFKRAIRINPQSKLISYLQLVPGQLAGQNPVLVPEEVTPLKGNDGFYNVIFVGLNQDELIDPLSVLVSANHEPDLGLDIGLYTDNGTEWGQLYGFGTQPFGDPKLEYGSQAPFHMGLYHEAGIINLMAPFIQECYPEYRIHLYKTLSELAFRMGEDYWGWRFMGWGLHYIGDLVQPYHARALPGVGVFKMISMNILDILGRSRMKDEAIQIVSNRHLAIEMLERQILENAYLDASTQSLQFETLSKEVVVPHYVDMIPRSVIAKRSYAEATRLDQIIVSNFPKILVSDPGVEFDKRPEKDEILKLLQATGDTGALENLEQELNMILSSFSVYGRSYVQSIVQSL
ncbi:MAG: hypothetical protein HQ507_09685 [Candidatus Marinimicrobia bacterium]|nr:hypothetical protein [Candidatus Neomarinimicrobiota bacterium]